MKSINRTLLCTLLALLLMPAKAQWTYYNCYAEAIDAIEAKGLIYGLYKGGNLLIYDTATSEVKLLDKTQGLSDTDIRMIDYSAHTGYITLLYSNNNIDLYDIYSGKVHNMPEAMRSTIGEYQPNSLWSNQNHTLVATPGGLLHIHLRDASIAGFYRIGAVRAARIEGDTLYARMEDTSILHACLKDNLQDPTKWTPDTIHSYLPGYGRNNATALTTLKANVSTIGPAQAFCYKLRHNGRYLTSIGGRIDGTDQLPHHPACVMFYNNKEWTRLSTDYSADEFPLQEARFYRDAADALEDPTDPNHMYVALYGAGLMEYRNGKMVKRYGCLNSPLETAAPGFPNYTRVSALAFDKDNTLWMVNNSVDTLLVSRTQDGKWQKHYFSALKGSTEVNEITIDQKGRIWVADCRYAGTHKGQLFAYDPSTGKNKARSSFVNEDGTTVNITECYTVKEDMNGQIWFGTNAGILVVENPDEWFDDDFLVLQVKVPRNDGTNFADYLLSGVFITCIAVDGANRKWIGTNDSGIYLVSEDGTEIIHHFDTTNSPLPNDCINGIAIDGTTGEIYLSTTNGLVSYNGEATNPTEGLDRQQIHIYPNPLRPENPRQIHITGLTSEAEVKIATLGGQVVASGHSIGGSFTWDASNQSGAPCGSGIYLVLISTNDGKHSVAGKLAIVR